MIYSQSFLMAQGLAVTWDNPDIHLEKAGVQVASDKIEANTDYEIVARVWNGSPLAPAVGLPVRFSFIDFGIGGVTLPIGETTIDLPVNGAPGHPAFARMSWRTPSTPGHYCLRVELIWADDANPANNVGQENLTVSALNSPRAVFTLPVRNEARTRRNYRMAADAYEIPEPPPCSKERPGEAPTLTREEADRHKAAAVARHGLARFALPADWRVTIEPEEFVLAPGAERMVSIDITAPDGFEGRQAINIAALVGTQSVGGATVVVHT